MDTYDLVIIGGGISGLYTALRYQEIHPRSNIAILEASSKLGGRLQTYYAKDKSYQYETGGSRFNQYHTRLLALIKKYKCHTIPISSQKFLCTFDPSIETLSATWNPPTTFRSTRSIPLTSLSFGNYLEKAYSKKERHLFQTQFGYDAEFDKMNALDAIRIFERDFSTTSHYFMIKEGFSTLIQRMKIDLINKGVRIYTKCNVHSFDYKDSLFYLHTSLYTSPICARKVFFALPKKALMSFQQFKQSDWIQSVESIPLHRIYAQFTPTSDYLERRLTTELPIRQYIPVNPSLKIAMISYSDTQNADNWHHLYQTNPMEFKKHLVQQYQQLYKHCFQCTSDISVYFKWIRSYYWEDGVHVWKILADSARTSKYVRIPLGQRIPCYIVGEAYSMHQGWVEGALETVDEVFEKYL
jgi:monoamine oxidase